MQKDLPAYQNRYGHTSIVHHRKIFIFGGKFLNDKYSDLADLEYFSLEDSRWHLPSIHTKSILQLRRNHIADLVGSSMIIHGGINDFGEILNDTYLLYLNPVIKWSELHIQDVANAPFLAYHSCCIVASPEIKSSSRFSVYRLPPVYKKINRNSASEIIKGLYLFGGKTKNNKLSNEVWILKFGKKPLEWVNPQIKGKGPSERCLHSMNYHEEREIIIIHGGRNDMTDSDFFSYSDTFILYLSKMMWVEVIMINHLYKNFNVFSRCSHEGLINGKFNQIIFIQRTSL